MPDSVLLPLALLVPPLVGLVIGAFVTKALGWFAHDRRRAVYFLAGIAVFYLGWAIFSLFTCPALKRAGIYALMALLWATASWTVWLRPSTGRTRR